MLRIHSGPPTLIFEFFGYTINRNYPDKVFQFPKEFFPIEMNEIQKKNDASSSPYACSARFNQLKHLWTRRPKLSGNSDRISRCLALRSKNLRCIILFPDLATAIIEIMLHQNCSKSKVVSFVILWGKIALSKIGLTNPCPNQKKSIRAYEICYRDRTII